MWELEKAHSCLTVGVWGAASLSGRPWPRRWEHLGCGGSRAEHRWMGRTEGKRKATEGQAIRIPISEDEETEAPG